MIKYSLIFFLVLIGCQSQSGKNEAEKMIQKNYHIDYLALGDSYTIGEAVEEKDQWPVQLSKRLMLDSILVDNLEIIAKTGWTTDELMEGIKNASLAPSYDLVSLLIGVNNQYRAYPIDQYRKEFNVLLDEAIRFAGGNQERVFVVSIPDYGVTPFAMNRNLDTEKIYEELQEYNRIADSIASLREVAFINITPGSRRANEDPSLIATDGLHPSGKMYEQWVEEIYPVVRTKF